MSPRRRRATTCGTTAASLTPEPTLPVAQALRSGRAAPDI